MHTQRFTSGKAFVWRSATYVVHRTLPEQQMVIEQYGTTVVTTVPLVTLVQALLG